MSGQCLPRARAQVFNFCLYADVPLGMFGVLRLVFSFTTRVGLPASEARKEVGGMDNESVIHAARCICCSSVMRRRSRMIVYGKVSGCRSMIGGSLLPNTFFRKCLIGISLFGSVRVFSSMTLSFRFCCASLGRWFGIFLLLAVRQESDFLLIRNGSNSDELCRESNVGVSAGFESNGV